MKLIKSITKEKKLVIFDFFGTLVGNTESDAYIPKKGIDNLLNILYSEKKILAVSSDAPLEDVSISFLFDLHKEGVYKGWNTYFEDRIFQGWRHIVSHNDYNRVKNLGEILSHSNIQPSDAVFIGDNYMERDKRSAKAFGIDFILVKPNTNLSELYTK
jgi:phosphoglycolate phosphatase-like HAD superfamily hydrolase